MATREGIYVGGKDIIERYVGTRLVWSKWVYVGYFQNLRNMFDSNGYLIFNVSGADGGFNTKYREKTKVKDVKIRIQHRNNMITTVYAKYAEVFRRETGQDNYNSGNSLYISFKDDNQKQVFKSNFKDYDSLFFYFK